MGTTSCSRFGPSPQAVVGSGYDTTKGTGWQDSGGKSRNVQWILRLSSKRASPPFARKGARRDAIALHGLKMAIGSSAQHPSSAERQAFGIPKLSVEGSSMACSADYPSRRLGWSIRLRATTLLALAQECRDVQVVAVYQARRIVGDGYGPGCDTGLSDLLGRAP